MKHKIIMKYTIAEIKERILTAIAWRLPRPLVYWCYIRVASHATTGKWDTTEPDSLSMMEALKRWDGAD